MKFVQSSSYQDTVVEELRRNIEKLAAQWVKVLRIDVVIAPTTAYLDYRLSGIKSWKEFLYLTMIHWYLPKEAFALVHLELQKKSNKFGTDKEIVAHTILRSEPEMVIFFMESSVCFKDERQLFGFLLRTIDLKRYHFQVLRPKKPKPTVRRRGYNDQGSRRLPHEQHFPKYDWSYTDEQNRIEEERRKRKDLEGLIEGLIQ